MLQEIQQVWPIMSVGAPSEGSADQSPAGQLLVPVMRGITAEQLKLVELARSEVGYWVPVKLQVKPCIVGMAGGRVLLTARAPHVAVAANGLGQTAHLSLCGCCLPISCAARGHTGCMCELVTLPSSKRIHKCIAAAAFQTPAELPAENPSV